MFTRPEIAALSKNFVAVELYTDGTDESSKTNGEMEEKRFKTVAIPYYVILDPDEKVLATFPGLTRNPKEFELFLKVPAKR